MLIYVAYTQQKLYEQVKWKTTIFSKLQQKKLEKDSDPEYLQEYIVPAKLISWF